MSKFWILSWLWLLIWMMQELVFSFVVESLFLDFDYRFDFRIGKLSLVVDFQIFDQELISKCQLWNWLTSYWLIFCTRFWLFFFSKFWSQNYNLYYWLRSDFCIWNHEYIYYHWELIFNLDRRTETHFLHAQEHYY